MTVSKVGRGFFRKSMTSLSCALLLLNGAAPVVAASSTAAITGVIVDPSGHPAYGFKVVLRDVASNQKFESEPTDAQGNYTAQVPLGGRYKIDHVIADDGVTELPVQDAPPVSVLTPGTTLVNVRFANGPAPPGTSPGDAPTTHKTNNRGGVAWYRKPGPIVGMVLGSAALVALLAGGGGGSSSSASPSTPGE